MMVSVVNRVMPFCTTSRYTRAVLVCTLNMSSKTRNDTLIASSSKNTSDFCTQWRNEVASRVGVPKAQTAVRSTFRASVATRPRIVLVWPRGRLARTLNVWWTVGRPWLGLDSGLV